MTIGDRRQHHLAQGGHPPLQRAEPLVLQPERLQLVFQVQLLPEASQEETNGSRRLRTGKGPGGEGPREAGLGGRETRGPRSQRLVVR